MLVWDDKSGQYVELGDSLSQYPSEGPKTLSNPYSNPSDQSAYVQKLKAMSAPQSPELGASAEEKLPVQKAESVDASKAVSELQGATGKQQDAAGMLTAAGAIPSPASPYLVGAGLGLQALSMAQKQKNEQAAQKYQAEVQKYNARQAAIARMAQLGQSLKA